VILEVVNCVHCRKPIPQKGATGTWTGHYKVRLNASAGPDWWAAVLSGWHTLCYQSLYGDRFPTHNDEDGCFGEWEPWMGIQHPRDPKDRA
jgi:hypothetical protein